MFPYLLSVNFIFSLDVTSINGRLSNIGDRPRSLSLDRLSDCIMKRISNFPGKNGGASIINPVITQQVE